MDHARHPPDQRLGVGQLLVRLLSQYRREALAEAADLGYGDIRVAHLQIFAHLGRRPVRLTELAARAQLSLAATSEVVSELDAAGYVDRRSDPGDGRAKLIVLTAKGRRAYADSGSRVREIERHWAGIVGPRKFEEACRVLQELLGHLAPPLGPRTELAQTAVSPSRSGGVRHR